MNVCKIEPTNLDEDSQGTPRVEIIDDDLGKGETQQDQEMQFETVHFVALKRRDQVSLQKFKPSKIPKKTTTDIADEKQKEEGEAALTRNLMQKYFMKTSIQKQIRVNDFQGSEGKASFASHFSVLEKNGKQSRNTTDLNQPTTAFSISTTDKTLSSKQAVNGKNKKSKS